MPSTASDRRLLQRKHVVLITRDDHLDFTQSLVSSISVCLHLCVFMFETAWLSLSVVVRPVQVPVRTVPKRSHLGTYLTWSNPGKPGLWAERCL